MALPDFTEQLEAFAKAAASSRRHTRSALTEYEHALDLIIESEPKTVNLTQCAKALGVSRVTLYRHLEERVAAEQEERTDAP